MCELCSFAVVLFLDVDMLVISSSFSHSYISSSHSSQPPFSHPPTGTFKYQPSRLSDTTAPDVILAKAKMILNKLSVTNFHKLSDEFMGVGIDSEDLMGRAVEMIVVCAQVSDMMRGQETRDVGYMSDK